jgi:hypothetical protein
MLAQDKDSPSSTTKTEDNTIHNQSKKQGCSTKY